MKPKQLLSRSTILLRTLFLLCSLNVCQITNAATINYEYGGLKYTINTSTTQGIDYNYAEVTGLTTSNASATSVIIPITVTYNNTAYPVTKIATRAFSNNTNLTKVNYKITYLSEIGYGAFSGCTKLMMFATGDNSGNNNTILIADNIKKINNTAFDGCPLLTKLVLRNVQGDLKAGNGNGTGAFTTNTYVTSATIYGGVPEELFKGNTSLASVSILNPTSSTTVTSFSVGECAFYKCSNLKSMTIESKIVTIGTLAFAETGFTSVTIPETVKTIETGAFEKCASLTTVNISSANIGSASFQNCTRLSSLNMNNTVRTIGSYAFSGCSLVDINIPEGVTTIDASAFASSKNYGTVTIPSTLNPNTSGYWFVNSSIGTLILNSSKVANCYLCLDNVIGTSNIEKIVFNVSDISSRFSTDNISLKKLEFNKENTFIGDEAFKGCTGLTELNIKVSRIAKGAFMGCTGISKATINCYRIDEMAFAGCTGLTTLNLTVNESIGLSAFSGCIRLSSTTLNALPISWNPCFQNCTGTVTINCNSSNKSASITANNCLFYGSAFTSASTKYFDVNLFTGCMMLKSVTLDTPTSLWTSCMLDGCPNVSQILLKNAPTTYKVDGSGYVYVETANEIDIQFIPPTLTSLTLSPKIHYFAPGSISKFRGVIDATQLTSFPTIGDGSSEATVICKPEMETQFKKYFKNVITQSGGLKGDMNNDGKVTISDVNILVDEILNK